MQMTPLEGNGYRQEPIPASAERPSVDPQRGVPHAEPQNTFPSPTSSSRPPGTGLLSNWKANAASSATLKRGVPHAEPQNTFPSSTPSSRPPGTGLLSNWKANAASSAALRVNAELKSLTEQETLEHEAVGMPVTGPAHYPGNGTNGFSRQAPQLGTAPPFAMFVPLSGQGMQPQQAAAVGPYPQLHPNVPMPGTRPAQARPAWHQYGPRPLGHVLAPTAQALRPAPYKKKKRMSTRAGIVLCMMFVPLLVVGSVAGYYYYSLSAPISSILNQQVRRLPGDEDPNQLRGSGGSVLTGGRINILLLGSDTDEKFKLINADGTYTYLAQTDIVVSVDPATKDVTMFSIPRDFWVNVPGFGMHKLDEAYALGGIALSRLTIFQDFGIHINYYAWVGLNGFVKVIDTVGGVDIDVIHPITDDQYPDDVGNNTQDIYRYKRLYLAPGPQHLGGIEALEYVRSRHADLVGDFGRSARQQQVLKQLKNKLNNPGIVEKFQELANDLAGYVKTDMQLTDIFSLLRYARSIDTSKINQITLGPPYSNSGPTPKGESVVFPHCDLIVPVIAKVFGSTADARCNVTTSGNTAAPGLASQTPPVSKMADGVVQTASQMANVSAMSLNGGNGYELLGIHSLLDLLFLIVFESPEALQV